MRELSLAILDIAENSIKASATKINISVKVDNPNGLIYIMIADNGEGTDRTDLYELELSSLDRPEGGMGLVLLDVLAHLCGGSVKMTSIEGEGTTVKATMKICPDLPPLGDISSSVATLMLGGADVVLEYEVDGKSFRYIALKGSNYNDVVDAVNDNIENINGGNPYEKCS